MLTTAKKTPDGKNYIINGEKKWVTQGKWADHGLVAARTGAAGAKGISMFIVPLASMGISRRSMENSGVKSSGKLMVLKLNDFKDLTYELQDQPTSSSMKFSCLLRTCSAQKTVALKLSCPVRRAYVSFESCLPRC